MYKKISELLFQKSFVFPFIDDVRRVNMILL